MASARSLSEFQTSFPDERSCAAFLFERRWPQGFVCSACGGGRAALLKSRPHDSPAPASAPKNSDRNAGRRIKTRKIRTLPRFGFDPPALDIDQPGTTG